jgi:hypothetical protein
MDIDRLKLIDKVLGVVVISSFIIAIFYQQLLLEVGVLALFWLVLDTYVAFKTSKLDFVIDILLIATFVILPFFVPNIYSLSTLASLMPSIPGVPKKTLAVLVIVGGLLAIVALYAIDVIRMMREVEIVL